MRINNTQARQIILIYSDGRTFPIDAGSYITRPDTEFGFLSNSAAQLALFSSGALVLQNTDGTAWTGGVLPSTPPAVIPKASRQALRLADKAALNKPALTRALVWSAGLQVGVGVGAVIPDATPVVRRLPDNPLNGVNAPSAGQLVFYTKSGVTAGAPAAGADPFVFSTTGEMTDGTAKCWALGQVSRPVPAGVAIPTVTPTAGNTAKPNVVNFKADRGKFLQRETPNIIDAANANNSVAWLYNNGGTNEPLGAGYGVGCQAYKRSIRFRAKSSAVVDIVHIPNGSTFIGASRPRIYVDDHPLEEVPSPHLGDGTTQRFVVSYAAAGGAARRRWRIEVPPGCSVRGLGLDVGDKVEPDDTPGITLLALGDSFDLTTSPMSSFAPSETLIEMVARDIGARFLLDMHEGGTGYLATSTNARKGALWIMQNNDTSSYDVDVIALTGLVGNDVGAPGAPFSAAQIADAALATWRLCRQQHPDAFIYVGPGWQTTAALSAASAAADAAVQAAYVAWGDPNSEYESSTSGTIVSPILGTIKGTPWITGLGYAGGPQDGGNSDYALGFDAAHPSPAGRVLVHRPRLAASLERSLTLHGR